MRFASLLPPADPHGPSLRRRATAVALTILLHLLLLLMLLTLAPAQFGLKPGQPTLTTFNLSPDQGQTEARAPKAAQKAKAGGNAGATPPKTIPPPVLPPDTPAPPPQPVPWLQLSDADVASTDRTMRSGPPGPARAADAGAAAGSGGDGAGGGRRAPNGERMYRADWYREPTDAELAPYIQGRAPNGAWAEIACRTADRYRVEDCQELDESPVGSGLARGLRQAAFQFLVRPPRKGGQALIGVWVYIRFTFTERKDAP